MTDQIPVKAVKTGTAVMALAEFGPGDLIAAAYLPIGTGGSGISLSGVVDTYADLPTLTAGDAGQAWLVSADGLVYAWDGTAWPADGAGMNVRGPAGADGKPGQIRFTGHGAPGTIIGASPADTYMDLDTGDLYKLT